MALDVSIVTVHDIFQEEAERKSLFSDEYRNQSALIILDKKDMAELGVEEGQRLLVKNDVGSVVVAAKASQDDAHPGLAFMYNSPWSNQLVSDELCDGSITVYGGIRVTVQPAEGSEAGVTGISEIFSRIKV
jgi:formylmethanofuran dehydrogenase subunit D